MVQAFVSHSSFARAEAAYAAEAAAKLGLGKGGSLGFHHFHHPRNRRNPCQPRYKNLLQKATKKTKIQSGSPT
jgi:gamma-glutamyl:cysteine ligase YbdK (ATP-grasp superfamily)